MRALLLLLPLLPCLEAQFTVSLDPSLPSPAPVGTVITWTAKPSIAGSYWYRFRVRRVGQDFRTVVDSGPSNMFDWTATDHEGVFEIEVSARDLAGGSAIAAKARFEFVPRVTGRAPVVSATSHPLVFLYSAPPCAPESRMRVRFRAAGEEARYTPWKNCAAGLSMNFYLAGMYPRTRYSTEQIIDTGSAFHEGPAVHFTTAKEAILPATEQVAKPLDGPGMLLQATIGKNVIATDYDGKLLWYYPKTIILMTEPQDGGFFWATAENGALREFDLTGMTVTETTVARVNEQLSKMGKPRIASFHHDARRLPDGKILVLASEERLLSDVQGPGPVDIIGDQVIVLDRDLYVVWTWDAFDHLDVRRKATLNETCTSCATLAKIANDWTHLNSAELTPDGNLLISARNQDFIYKIDYENGEGDGHVIWKLGQGGDFPLTSSGPSPWFSHQHDARYSGDSTITLFDDGNLRQAADPGAHSRGQALHIDETRMTAELILNADLGVFSSALGSAQKLPDGNYMFLAGFLPDNSSLITEVDPSGRVIYQMRTGSQQYRVFQMRDLYTAPQ